MLPKTGLADIRKLTRPKELREYNSKGTGQYCFDSFDKDEVGDVVLSWMEDTTGVKEDEVVGWEEAEPADEDERWWFVLSAVTC